MSTEPTTSKTDRVEREPGEEGAGTGRRPNDRLNKDQPSTEGAGAPVRKSSLL